MNRQIAINRILSKPGVLAIREKPPFMFGSGLIAPIFIDFMSVFANAEDRALLSKALIKLAREKFSGFDVIGVAHGTSTPWATFVATTLNLPLVCIPKRAKRYALRTQIEGILEPGSRVLLAGSSIGSGKNISKAIEKIRLAGCETVGLAAIFNYGTPVSATNFRKLKLSYQAITDLDSVIGAARRVGLVSLEQEKSIFAWQEDPSKWAISAKSPTIAPDAQKA